MPEDRPQHLQREARPQAHVRRHDPRRRTLAPVKISDFQGGQHFRTAVDRIAPWRYGSRHYKFENEVRTRFQLGGYRRQQLVRSVAAGLVAAAVGLILILTPLGATFESNYGLDWLFSRRGSRPQPPDITVVEINNDTGGELGRDGLLACPEPSVEQKDCENVLREPGNWPTRTVHARLIERLVEENARGIVFDLHFDHPKPGDDDLQQAIKLADRVILVEWLEGGNKQIVSKGRVNRGSVFFEKPNPPTKKLLEQAKAVGPFVLTKPDPKTFEFWAFKSDRPTIPAVALQLKGLDVYEDWLAILSAADPTGLDNLQARAQTVNSPCDMLWLNASGLEHLPARAQDVKSSCDMLRLMRTLRRIIPRYIVSTACGTRNRPVLCCEA